MTDKRGRRRRGRESAETSSSQGSLAHIPRELEGNEAGRLAALCAEMIRFTEANPLKAAEILARFDSLIAADAVTLDDAQACIAITNGLLAAAFDLPDLKPGLRDLLTHALTLCGKAASALEELTGTPNVNFGGNVESRH